MKNSTLAYPSLFHLEPQNGGYSISFPDFPEANSQGDDLPDAFRMAADCLHAVIEWRLEEKKEIPKPSKLRRGQHLIPVPFDIAPKIALLQLMRSKKISNVKLAAELKVSELVIRRMLDPKHQSKPEQYIRALTALGHAPQVSLIAMPKAS